VTVIPVIGMTCQNCVNKIESALAKFSSVVLVKVCYYMSSFYSLSHKVMRALCVVLVGSKFVADGKIGELNK